MDAVGGVGPPESGGSAAAAVVIDFPGAGGETAAVRIPRRIQKRLLESRGSPPSSVEEIEAKLKEANLRRQQFHEWLSSKARPKPRSPSWSSQEEDLGQRLEAKLYAAEQKRLSLLAKAQMKLARLDELRKAAKTGVAMRFEREREELGTKVESRVQKAEANRTRLMKAHMQRRAAAQERKTRSLLQRVIRETKYKECVHSSILEKRAAAEKKRMGLLEAEKIRARARVIQAHRIAKTVCHQRESERRKTKEQLENRLQKARRQRAEYLKQRGSSHTPARSSQNKLGDLLSRKLARCWRQFVMSRRTTFSLAKAYEALEINKKVVEHMPFEQLALRIESSITLQTVKALLDRLETRFLLSQFFGSSRAESIDHLLKRLATPKKRATPSRISRTRGSAKKVSKDLRISAANKLPRYPERVVLCAYMILGHPNAVFSGQGEPEVTLRESATEFVREFELLIRIILDGPRRQVSTDALSDERDHQQESGQLSCRSTFRSRLDAFDAAWRSYLYRFVVWKVKDARSLEEDLVRAACQLELSMMQTCKLTPEGQACNLSHDMRAIQKQVTEDKNLLREKVRHLSGDAGIERMECALSDTRSKYYEAKEQGSPMVGLVSHISSPTISKSSASLSGPSSEKRLQQSKGNSSRVVRSLFGNISTVPGTESQDVEAQSTPGMGKVKRPGIENELFVNEIVHEGCGTFTSTRHEEDVDGIKAKVKETLEKAFWDAILESVKRDEPNYDQIVGLVKEVRDELCEMAPHSWKQEILDSIDLDILSQVLESGTWDTDYLRKILEYALVLLQKLTSPANEDEMKRAHKKLLEDLENSARSDGKGNSSFALSTIKGLRFVLEQIQALKKEISKARIQLMEPIIKGSAGFEYLQKAFADRYGPPSAAANSLPKTVQWISTLSDNLEVEWNEHINSLSLLPINNGLSLVGTLRTGGSTVPLASKQSSHLVNASGSGEQPECNGEKVDRLVRLGLLKLASGIEGLTVDTVPETFELNTTRLRAVQSQLQQIIVISTSLLVFRQIVASENPALSQSELETAISDSAKRLSDLLDRVPEVGIEEIVETVSSPSSEVALLRGRKEVMTRLLSKSLRSDDAVFSKVSRAIEVAARGVVLGGSGPRGCRLADVALRRVGAGMLLDRLVKTGEALVAMADISVRVHEPWYGCLI